MRPRDDSPAEPFAARVLPAAAVASVLGMAFHPTGHELHAAADPHAVVLRSQLVHAVMIAVSLLQAFGSLALVRRLRATTLGCAELGAVCQGLATAAAIAAATCSGFLLPALLGDESAAATGAGRLVWLGNQVAAKVFVVAQGAAIALWSLRGAVPRALRAFGLLVAAGSAALLVSGALRLGVHGMGAVVLAHAAWWIGAALTLLRSRA
jgi:hypothetical protein